METEENIKNEIENSNLERTWRIMRQRDWRDKKKVSEGEKRRERDRERERERERERKREREIKVIEMT
jgi:hypothetical protein